MEEWYCFKCKEKMREADVWMTYLELTFSISGLKCPKCEAAYLTEETVVEKVAVGEEQIEAKR